MKSNFNLFGEFFKVEKSDDGTIYVEGYASSGRRDSDGEIVLPSAMRDALPEYMKFGTVREQHDVKKAAGTAVFAEVQEDGRTRFGARIVDPTTVLKVEHKVLKGFSIRGKALKRSKSDPFTIEKLRLSSIDIVDRGANPDAIVDLVKFDDGDTDATTEIHVHAIDADTFAKALDDHGDLFSKAVAKAIATHKTNEAAPSGEDSTMKTAATTTAVEKTADAPAPANPLGDALVKAMKEAIAADPSIVEKLGLSAKPMTDAERISKLESSVSELTESNNALVETLTKAFGGRVAAQAARKGVLRSVPIEKSDDIQKVDDGDDRDDEKDPVAKFFNERLSKPHPIAL